MPRPRFSKLTEERRRELLESAAGEFALHGYESASLNRILGAVGLSKGAFYYYFDDKADLFHTVTHFAFDDLLGRGDTSEYDITSLTADTFWQQLEQWFLELTQRLHDLPWLAGIGKLLYHPPAVDGVDTMVAQHFEMLHAWLAALLRRGRRLGAVRNDIPLLLQQTMLVGAMEGSDRWFVDHWERLSKPRREALAKLTFDVAKRMIATPEEGAARAATN